MKKYPPPSSEDQFQYLLMLYFGRDPDPLRRCIDRAYRDLNRTLHGFGRVPDGARLREDASAAVRSFLSGLANPQYSCPDQPTFDGRHEAACEHLCKIYSEARFATFHVGQAQKWINMALKYVYVFGESQLPGYSHAFQFAHVPIDNIILKHFYADGLRRLKTPWSRIRSYNDEYLPIQKWVQSKFSDELPLAVEFKLFMKLAE